ncbi:MAG: hypothetical protein IJL66_05110 [Lachnospiraceae bacterium]|nr:hypothetical protein [Lachnospiraceae bacterium]
MTRRTAAPQTTAEQTAEALPKAMEAARKYTEEYNNSPTVIRPIEPSY